MKSKPQTDCGALRHPRDASHHEYELKPGENSLWIMVGDLRVVGMGSWLVPPARRP